MDTFGDRVKRFMKNLASDPAQPMPSAQSNRTDDASVPFTHKTDRDAAHAAPTQTSDQPDERAMEAPTAPMGIDEAVAQLLEQQHDVATRVDRIADHIEQQTARVDEVTEALSAWRQAGREPDEIVRQIDGVSKALDELPKTSNALESRIAGQAEALSAIREQLDRVQQSLNDQVGVGQRIESALQQISQRESTAEDSLSQTLADTENRLQGTARSAIRAARLAAALAIVAAVAGLATLGAVIYMLVTLAGDQI